ncbi:hypothetical protein FRB97_005863 [Tulasnella sp. 331]|nr:hypothetical protein FRB97_005863 [Tulasnella sp. 331]
MRKAAKTGFTAYSVSSMRNTPKTAIPNLSHVVDQAVEKKLKLKSEGQPKDGKADTTRESADGDEWTEVKKIDASAPKEEEEPIVPVGMWHGDYKDLLNILLLAATNQLAQPDVHFTVLNAPRPNHTAAKGGEMATSRHEA